MDMDWIPPTIMALATFVAAVGSIWATISANKAKTQSVITHQAVNSRMDELLRLATANAKAEATLAEKTAEKVRQGEAAAIVVAATPPPDEVLKHAEERARSVIAEAAAVAAKMIADARTQKGDYQQNQPSPIPVEVVRGPGVDEPLQVTNKETKK